jgi:succinate dehydrogenase / fumarate reductase, cytochrome b subunit
MAYNYQAPAISHAFLWRRLHSLTGLFLVLFLIEHLLTNSQAALYVGGNGEGFIQAVNFLQGLPFLSIIEIIFLGFPFLIHGGLGIRYLMTGEYNSFATNGTKPDLSQYPRNHAYTWQRITAWILIFGVFAHVVHMRFFLHPSTAKVGTQSYFMTTVSEDKGLYTLSQRLGFAVYDPQQVKNLVQHLANQPQPPVVEIPEALIARQKWTEEQNLKQVIEENHLKNQKLLVVTPNFGMALLLVVRDVFKNPWMIALYTIFLLATTFHAFNGLWTFMITWGVTLTNTSQRIMRRVSTVLLILVSGLGLVSIWGSYWFNLFN